MIRNASSNGRCTDIHRKASVSRITEKTTFQCEDREDREGRQRSGADAMAETDPALHGDETKAGVLVPSTGNRNVARLAHRPCVYHVSHDDR